MKLKVFLIIFITIGISFSLYQMFIKEDAKIISAEEAKKIAVNLYGGKALAAELDQSKSAYHIKLENDKGIYYLAVDSSTKKISEIKLGERKDTVAPLAEAKTDIEKETGGQITKFNEVTRNGKPYLEATVKQNNQHYSVEYDLQSQAVVSNEKVPANEKPSPSITEQEAKAIALQQADGKVTNLSIVNTQRGRHYKVTVDNKAEGAHVYVQANTGNVSSVAWYSSQNTNEDIDDDNDDNNDDDNDTDDNNDDGDDD